jgi:endonuclease III
MKNATEYQKKIKKLLGGMGKARPDPPADAKPFRVMLEAILTAEATPKRAEKAMAAIEEEFVDINEIRVSPPKEIVDCLETDYPHGRAKGAEIVRALNAIFVRYNKLTLEPIEGLTKRDLRRHLAELGLSPYAAACMVLMVYAGHAIPVDEALAESLDMDGYVHPDSSVVEVQAFLERVILQRDALAAHEFFRAYVEKRARALARKRKADAEARAKAEAVAMAKAEAEAKVKAEAEAKVKAKARAKVARARKAAKAKAKKAAKRAGEKTAKKATKKSRAPAGADSSAAATKPKAAKKSKKSKKRAGR